MNTKTLSSRLIKTLDDQIAGWASLLRFLIALKSNRCFDCFLSPERMPGLTFDRSSHGKHCTPNSFRRATMKRHFPVHLSVRVFVFLLSTPIYFVTFASAAWAHGGQRRDRYLQDSGRRPMGTLFCLYTGNHPGYRVLPVDS